MKMVMLTFNISKSAEIIEVLRAEGVKNWQLINEVTGETGKGNPRLNTPVWPGKNSVIYVPLRDDEKAVQLIGRIKAINSEAYNEDELVMLQSWTLDDFIED